MSDIGPAEAETILCLTVTLKYRAAPERVAPLVDQIKTWPEVDDVTMRFAGDRRRDEQLRDSVMSLLAGMVPL